MRGEPAPRPGARIVVLSESASPRSVTNNEKISRCTRRTDAKKWLSVDHSSNVGRHHLPRTLPQYRRQTKRGLAEAFLVLSPIPQTRFERGGVVGIVQ